MEKECRICGDVFEAKRKNRLYCDKCRNHSERKKMWAEKNMEQANRRYDAMLWKPNIFDGECEVCKKRIKKEYRYVRQLKSVYDDQRHFFCSKECLKEYKRIEVR